MDIRNFVSGSSVILVGWLGATFFNEVPSQRYPKLDKPSQLRAEQKPHLPGVVPQLEVNSRAVVSTSN